LIRPQIAWISKTWGKRVPKAKARHYFEEVVLSSFKQTLLIFPSFKGMKDILFRDAENTIRWMLRIRSLKDPRGRA
jgi:hypothetical protein